MLPILGCTNFAGKSIAIKSAVTIFLMLLLNCQIFSNFLVMATFFVNEDYIAENLCVNRDRPELQCNGHCQLDKKLQEDHQDQQQNTDKRVNFEATVFLSNTTDHFCGHHIPLEATPKNGIPLVFTEQSYQNSLIHPPALG